MANAGVKRRVRAVKPPDGCRAVRRALLWWSASYAAMEQVAADARRVAREVRKPGSPLAVLFDPDSLNEFAFFVEDQIAHYANAHPRNGVVAFPDPLKD